MASYDVELLIQSVSTGTKYKPAVEGDIVWETERFSTPGKLTFTVLKDELLSFEEGDTVRLTVDGRGVFFGYVFVKSRDKEQKITVTAYDYLRYFKNKISYKLVGGSTVSTVVSDLLAKYANKVGTVDSCSYALANQTYIGISIFDIIAAAMDLTFAYARQSFVLYDDFGTIHFRNTDNLILTDPFINATALENFAYETNIDEDTYNNVLIKYKNATTGKTDYVEVGDAVTIAKWGKLTLCYGANDNAAIGNVANLILEAKNNVTRKLRLTNVKGDLNVRAGVSIPIQLNLGDVNTGRRFMCDKVVHHINADYLLMDIEVFDNKKWE